ncbi:hypothetical protein KIN20_015051 [Parelaphostrongylus tenuis]|uniref:Uncharacterized protein n=1 Tax=Parelaphostrongylus tenuis TaxID=148309 RepID=A0AAD5MIZ1_PARTN|nr:hypothetical protein KIN20_015051 [Parelaphostrongylus tenuis]
MTSTTRSTSFPTLAAHDRNDMFEDVKKHLENVTDRDRYIDRANLIPSSDHMKDVFANPRLYFTVGQKDVLDFIVRGNLQ